MPKMTSKKSHSQASTHKAAKSHDNPSTNIKQKTSSSKALGKSKKIPIRTIKSAPKKGSLDTITIKHAVELAFKRCKKKK